MTHLGVYWIGWIAHIMWNSCVDQWEEPLLANCHLIKNLLGDVNHLEHFVLPNAGFYLFFTNLNIFESMLVLGGNLYLHLVHVFFDIFIVHFEDLFQRIESIGTLIDHMDIILCISWTSRLVIIGLFIVSLIWIAFMKNFRAVSSTHVKFEQRLVEN